MKFTKAQKVVLYLVIVTRLLTPFFVFQNPLLGVLICMAADCFDYAIVLFGGIRVDQPKLHPLYQRVDKALDQYYYTFILFYLLSNYSSPITSIAICLYMWRLAGFALFQITNNRTFLIFGPNFFENFAFIIFSRPFFSIEITNQVILYAAGAAIIVKIPQEILIHGTTLLYKWDISPSIVNRARQLFGLQPFK